MQFLGGKIGAASGKAAVRLGFGHAGRLQCCVRRIGPIERACQADATKGSLELDDGRVLGLCSVPPMEIENLNPVKLAVFSAGARLGVKSNDTQRERLGQCVVAVAKHLGVSRQLIYTWMKDGNLNRAAFELARGLADAAGMPVEALGRPIAPAPPVGGRL